MALSVLTVALTRLCIDVCVCCVAGRVWCQGLQQAAGAEGGPCLTPHLGGKMEGERMKGGREGEREGGRRKSGKRSGGG